MRFRRSFLAAAAAALALFPAAAETPARPAAVKWDIQVTVDCDGQYGLESGETRCDGQYAFTAHWVGLMERDDEDFLLIHKSVELERWQASEKVARPEGIDLLETRDFAAKPDLRVHYVLRQDGALEIALSVLGFDVPRQAAPDTFRLALPASAEDRTVPAGVNYGAYVTQGSNRVFLEESAIAGRTEVRKFAWTWKWRAWIPKSDRNTLTFNTHKAAVTVAVTPHQEKPNP